jgi:hypothetical protein
VALRRLDPEDFRLDGDGMDTEEASTSSVPSKETRSMMTPEEIDELQSAVQAAIANGAPPEAMQPVNDFINRTAGEKPSAAYVADGQPYADPKPDPGAKEPEGEDTQPGGTA